MIAQIVISATDKASGVLKNVSEKTDDLSSKWQKFAGLAAAGGATAFLVNLVKNSIEAADALNDLSAGTGVAVDVLSGYQVAAKTAGVSNEELAKGLNKLSVAQVTADGDTKAFDRTFGRLGVTLREQNGELKNTDKMLGDVADAFVGLEDGPAKTALGVDLFGKSWLKLAPILAGGSDGLREAREIAQDLGLVLDKETAEAAGRTADIFDILGMASGGLGNQIMKKVLPTVEGLAQMFLESKRQGNAMEGALDGLVVVFKGVVTGGLVVTEVFKNLGTIAGGVVAGVMRAVDGDFKGAASAMSGAFSDVKKSNVEMDKTLTKLWDDTLPKVSEKTIATARSLKAQKDTSEDATKATKDLSDGLDALEKSQRATSSALAEAGVSRLKIQLESEDKLLKQSYVNRAITDGEYYDAKASAARRVFDAQITLLQNQKVEEEKAQAAFLARSAVAGLAEKDRNKLLQEAEGTKQKIIKVDQDIFKLTMETTSAIAAQGFEIEANWFKSEAAAASAAKELVAYKQSLSDQVTETRAYVDLLGIAPEKLERINALRTFDKETAKLVYDIQVATNDLQSLQIIWGEKEGQLRGKEIADRLVINEGKLQSRTATRSVLDAQLETNEATKEQISLLQKINGYTQSWLESWFSGKSLIKAVGDTLKREIISTLAELASKRIVIPIIGGLLGISGSAMAGVTSGASGLLGGLTGTSGIMSGLGTLISTLGPIAAVAGVLSSLDKKGGGPKTEGGYSTGGGLLIRGGGVADAEAGAAARSITAQYASIMGALGRQGQTLNAAVQFSQDNGAGGDALTQLQVAANLGGRNVFNLNPNYMENVGRGADALKAGITINSLRAVVAALQNSELDSASAAYIGRINLVTDSAEQLQTALDKLTSITTVTRAVEGLGGVFSSFAALSIEARDGFLSLVGGVEAFASKTKTFTENYYSEAEQAALAARSIAAQLRAAGITGDLTSRGDLRSLLDSQNLATETSRVQAAALLNVSSEFSSLATYLQANNTTLNTLAGAGITSAFVDAAAAQAQQANAQAETQNQTQRNIEQLARDQVAAIKTAAEEQIAAIVRVIVSTSDTADSLRRLSTVGIKVLV